MKLKTSHLSHKQKKRLAKKHMTISEIKAHVSPWLSKWWLERKTAIINHIGKQKLNRKVAKALKKSS